LCYRHRREDTDDVGVLFMATESGSRTLGGNSCEPVSFPFVPMKMIASKFIGFQQSAPPKD